MTLIKKSIVNDWQDLHPVSFAGAIAKHSFWLIAPLVFTPTVAIAKPVEAIAQENSLIICETASTTVRVYEENDDLLMRAYDRNRRHVWMNRTMTSVRGTNTGLEYTNELGELAVRVSVDLDDGSCAIQVNDAPAESGTVLRNDTVHSVIGTITYRERIALPPNTTLITQLVGLDASEPETLAEQRMVTAGEQVPIPFHLFYSPDEINLNHPYAVMAQMMVDGELRWTTPKAYPVITQNAPFAVEVVVNLVANDAASESPNPVGEEEPLPEAIASAIKTAFVAEFGATPFQIDQYSRETWSDGCLELGGPDESCLAVITDGWRVAIVDLTTDQRYVYRTTLSGNSVRRE